MRILVADIDGDVRKLLAELLPQWGHEVLFADDGEQAWTLLQQTSVQFLISGWALPAMDGPGLCRKIRAAQLPAYVYFILLTARGDKQGIMECIKAGADDYLAMPFDFDELRVRIDAGIRMLRIESELRDKNDSIAAAYATIQRDMEAAAKMQQSLLPAQPAVFGNAAFHWLFLPSLFVAGDILNYFRILDNHHAAFYLLDVSGHGVPSAMLSFTLSKMISPNNANNLLKAFNESALGRVSLVPPEKVLFDLNHAFQGGPQSELYFTMVYGVLDTDTGELRFCQAGHPSPVFIAAGEPAAFLGDGGFPVGMLPDLTYEACALTMKKGDRFFLYSDGVTECAGVDGELFGEARLLEFFEGARDLAMSEVNQALKEALLAWRGGDEFEDDVSVLSLEMA